MKLTNRDCQKYKQFISKICGKTASKYPSGKALFGIEDLESEAWIALDRAKETYRKDLMIPFKAYAYRVVYNHLVKYININLFKVTTNYNNIKNNKEELEKLLPKNTLNLSSTKVYGSVDYFDIKDKNMLTPLDYIINKCDIKAVQEVLNTLDKRSQVALVRKFRDEMTLEEISKILKCTKQEVANIINDALFRMKPRLKTRGINNDIGI